MHATIQTCIGERKYKFIALFEGPDTQHDHFMPAAVIAILNLFPNSLLDPLTISCLLVPRLSTSQVTQEKRNGKTETSKQQRECKMSWREEVWRKKSEKLEENTKTTMKMGEGDKVMMGKIQRQHEKW